MKNSDDQTLLNWIEDKFNDLNTNGTNTHLDALYSSRDNDPDYVSASNTYLKIIDIIEKRLQINPKFWQNALFDFSAFARAPKRHLLSWIPHTWGTTIFSTLTAAEKRDATATCFALWAGSKDALPRRTGNLLCTFVQDKAISSQPLTTEMVNTFQASLKNF